MERKFPEPEKEIALSAKLGYSLAGVSWPGEKGNFVRLSHACYNVPSDFERLRDAVETLIAEQ